MAVSQTFMIAGLTFAPLVALAAGIASCHGSASVSVSVGGDGGAQPFDAGPVTVDPSPVPVAEAGAIDPNPTNPIGDNGDPLGWSTAPLMPTVDVQPNRDSAILVLPAVTGVVDYRAILIPAGTTVTSDANGAETIKGTTIFCAGYRQHAAPIAPLEVLRQIEVTGLAKGTRVVIEAIDASCPFPGIRGQTHHDFTPPQQDVPPADQVPFSIYTDQEIIAKYGSLIINGQGPAATLAAQADPITPKVLARTTIMVAPTGYAATPPTSTFFDDFGDPTDQPKFVKNVPEGVDRSQFSMLYQNSKWNLYTYDAANSQMYIDRGSLRLVIGDWEQDVMSSNLAIPKKPAQLSLTDYLHITFEAQTDATGRRYWWLSLCGAPAMGQTFDAQGNFLGNIIQTSAFMDNDGLNPSLEGWNCFQLFPRNGWPATLPPNNQNPETEVRLMMNAPGNLGRDNVINPDPPQFDPNIGPASWFRQIDKNGNPIAPILDDQQLIAPRTRYDVYLKRDQVIMLVNGQQRLCNSFVNAPLSMAEAAVGFGQVFYHSSAEREELLTEDYWVETGKRYIIQDSPYLDVRTYDNVGFTEYVAAPDGFDPTVCHAFLGKGPTDDGGVDSN